MTRRDPHPKGLSRDESRFLDGESPPDAARRLEHELAADPERAERVEAYREAMDVWREDAARVAQSVDPRGTLADRVLDSVTGEQPPRQRTATAVPGWYAAAAVALIAVGVAGTLLARRNQASAAQRSPEFRNIEEAVVNLVLERQDVSPRLTSLKEGR